MLSTNAKRSIIACMASKLFGDEVITALDSSIATTVVEDAISNGVVDKSPSENIVFDGLALKANLISPSFTTPNVGAATATSVNGLTLASSTASCSVAGGTSSKTLVSDTTIAVSALAPKASPSFTTPNIGAALATSLNSLDLLSKATGYTIEGGAISKKLTMDTTIAVSSLAPLVSPVLTAPDLGAALATTVNGITPTAIAVGFTLAGGSPASRTLTVDTDVTISDLAPLASPVLTAPTLGVALATSINGVTLVAAGQDTTNAAGEITIADLTVNAVVLVTPAEAFVGGFGYVIATPATLTIYDMTGTGINAKKVNYLVISK
jgi:hypothetical protein